MYIEEE